MPGGGGRQLEWVVLGKKSGSGSSDLNTMTDIRK